MPLVLERAWQSTLRSAASRQMIEPPIRPANLALLLIRLMARGLTLGMIALAVLAVAMALAQGLAQLLWM